MPDDHILSPSGVAEFPATAPGGRPTFRYRRLGYLKLEVTDLERSTAFATEVFGLDLVRDGPDGARYFRAGPNHHDLILAPAAKPGLVRSSWELESLRELDVAFTRLTEAGFSPAWVGDDECKQLRLARAFRCVDPVIGSTWEYFAEMTWLPRPRKNLLTRFQGSKHFGLVVPDGPQMLAAFVGPMGFMVSDYFDNGSISLLRAWPNPNHHSVAALHAPGTTPRLHHLAFMVEEIDDIGRLFNRARRLGAEIQWGIGRHPTSGSIHLYIYDPDSFVWEYTLGMEQFPEAGAREPRRMSSAPEDFDLWDAIPDGSRREELPEVRIGLSDPLRIHY